MSALPAEGESARKVPIAWEGLEDAFENNASEVHSFLNLSNGEVVRVVDGAADAALHRRLASDPEYLAIEAVSSREQYRWMERFIETVEDAGLRTRLAAAIDGKGAFRRFKDALMNDAVERERWFAFRSARLQVCMQTWLDAHRIEAVERPEVPVPTADEVLPHVPREPAAKAGGTDRSARAEALRKRAVEMLEKLPDRDLETAVAFLEFLEVRKPMPRVESKPPPPRKVAPDKASGSR